MPSRILHQPTLGSSMQGAMDTPFNYADRGLNAQFKLQHARYTSSGYAFVRRSSACLTDHASHRPSDAATAAKVLFGYWTVPH